MVGRLAMNCRDSNHLMSKIYVPTNLISHLSFRCIFCSSFWHHIRIWLSVCMAISILNSAVKRYKKESTGSSCIEGLIVLSSTIYYTTFVQYEIEELSGFS